jgi:glycogen(starch) synthase
MRVLHLTTEFPPLVYGGLGTAIGALVRASSRVGIEVAVLLAESGCELSYHPPPLAAARPTAVSGIKSPVGIHLHPVSHVDAEAYGTGLIEEWRPDVLHLHVSWLWPLARVLRARTGIPLVYTVHSLDRAEYELGQDPSEYHSHWDLQADLIGSADLIIALTRNERDLLIEYCPAVQDRIRVVGNGIEDTVDARLAARRRRTNDAPIILFTGRFVERKGVKEFLGAAALVTKKVPDARFVLAGGHRHYDGASMARYWMPDEFPVPPDRVCFTGWLSAEELAGWYRKADILAVPSRYEPFGMVVLEGMLHGNKPSPGRCRLTVFPIRSCLPCYPARSMA